MSSNIALKKLASDLRDSVSGDYAGQFNLSPITRKTVTELGTIEEEPNLFHWNGSVFGPEGTPYEGGVFRIDIVIPEMYPNKPPMIKFVTKVYHPNIDKSGQICLNILRSPPNGDWKPSLNLPKTILSVHSLLSEPNPNDPLNPEAGRLLTEDKEAFHAMAKEWTDKFATKL